MEYKDLSNIEINRLIALSIEEKPSEELPTNEVWISGIAQGYSPLQQWHWDCRVRKNGKIYWDAVDTVENWDLFGKLFESLPEGTRLWKTKKQWFCAKINGVWASAKTPGRAVGEYYLRLITL